MSIWRLPHITNPPIRKNLSVVISKANVKNTPRGVLIWLFNQTAA